MGIRFPNISQINDGDPQAFALQAHLKLFDPAIVVDGIIGPKTHAALQKWLALSNGIGDLGKHDKITPIHLQALRNYMGAGAEDAIDNAILQRVQTTYSVAITDVLAGRTPNQQQRAINEAAAAILSRELPDTVVNPSQIRAAAGSHFAIMTLPLRDAATFARSFTPDKFQKLGLPTDIKDLSQLSLAAVRQFGFGDLSNITAPQRQLAEMGATILAANHGIALKITGAGAPPFPANILQLASDPILFAQISPNNAPLGYDRFLADTIKRYVENGNMGAYYYDAARKPVPYEVPQEQRGLNQHRRIALEWSIQTLATNHDVERPNGKPLVHKVDGQYQLYPTGGGSVQDRMTTADAHGEDIIMPAIERLMADPNVAQLLGSAGAGLRTYEAPFAENTSFWVSSPYGHRHVEAVGGASKFHQALDAAVGVGTEVQPMRDGKLLGLTFDRKTGLTVSLEHRETDGSVSEHTAYVHLGSIINDTEILNTLEREFGGGLMIDRGIREVVFTGVRSKNFELSDVVNMLRYNTRERQPAYTEQQLQHFAKELRGIRNDDRLYARLAEIIPADMSSHFRRENQEFLLRHPEFLDFEYSKLADPAYVARLDRALKADRDPNIGLRLFDPANFPSSHLTDFGSFTTEQSFAKTGMTGATSGSHLHVVRILNYNGQGIDQDALSKGHLDAVNANYIVPPPIRMGLAEGNQELTKAAKPIELGGRTPG